MSEMKFIIERRDMTLNQRVSEALKEGFEYVETQFVAVPAQRNSYDSPYTEAIVVLRKD